MHYLENCKRKSSQADDARVYIRNFTKMKQIRVSSTDVVFEKTRGNIKSDNINIFSVCLHTLEGKSVNSSLKTLRGVRWTKMYYICKHTDGKQTNGRTVVRLCATTFSHGAYKDDMITKINKFFILVQGITPLCRNYPSLIVPT